MLEIRLGQPGLQSLAQGFERPPDVGLHASYGNAELFGERSGDEANARANCQIPLETQKPHVIYRGNHCFDNAMRDRMRRFSLHHKLAHANRAIDAAPAVDGQIEFDEKVAREERCLDGGELAGMADRLQPLRQEHAKTLLGELSLSLEFAMR